MSLRRLLTAVLLLGACSPAAAPPAPRPTPKAARPAPAPPPTASAAPSATAQASAAPPIAKGPPPPLPRMETPELQEKLAFLAPICPAAVQRDKEGKQQVGCATCAPFEGDARGDGTVQTNPEYFFPLEHLYPGSFTRAGADEAAAVMVGCEPHAGNYGGTLLGERKDGVWQQIRYDSGVHPDSCITYRRKDGRDVLVCRWGDGHQTSWHEMVFAYDFAESTPDDVEKGWHEIVTMDDTSTTACVLGSLPGEPVRSGRVDKLAFEDRDKDGVPDLVVTVSQSKSMPSKPFKAKCKELTDSFENDIPKHVDVASALGKRKKFVLVFTYNGSTFVPTKQTAAVIAGF
jgi:hypothetical protein